MDHDSLTAMFDRRTVVEDRRPGITIRQVHDFARTHIEVWRAGQPVPTYQGVVYAVTNTAKGWPAQFAKGSPTTKTHVLRGETFYPTKEAAVAALIAHQSRRPAETPDWQPPLTAPEFAPGDRVQTQDLTREPHRYPFATIVRAATRGEYTFTIDPDAGYVVRYDNGDEVWVRDHYVLEPNDTTDPIPAGVDAAAWRATRELAPEHVHEALDAAVRARRAGTQTSGQPAGQS